ncbi:hypothetical protein LEL_03827 [Akanthomyces lecanii RCEF 1005]|uniref:Uncharacterized protein n=1 Tax=Akanthomyces lecanii RCEF 1005 TaxID=1081108 RepID=A0A168JEP9_CORDF|nr:hypothetical protein LEL_03827 [Akanthomyces lecanii RCEF 1005]
MSSNLLRTNFGHYPFINNAYTRFRYWGIVRWVVDLAILGFAIPVLARNPAHDLLIASAYSVGAAGLCVVLFVPLIGPRSQSDPRPSAWVMPALAITQVALIPAAALLIKGYSSRDGRYSRRDLSAGRDGLDKRIYISHGSFSGSLEQRLALVGGCCCIASIVAGIAQLYYLWRIHSQTRNEKMMANATIETVE